MLSGQDFIANLSDQLKLIDPISITWDDIGKLLLVISLKHFKQLLINRFGTHLAKIFRTFKCFFKLKLTVDSEMPTFHAISQTVTLAFP